jgi:hypothetical protein
MNLKRWCWEVHSKAEDEQVNFTREYVKLVPSILEAIRAFHGVKTDVQYHFNAEAVANFKPAGRVGNF